MKRILVADIMTRSPNIIQPETNLLECAKQMVRKRAGSLLIVDSKNKKKLVGIISRRDILWALVKKSKEDLSKIRAIDISPRKIAVVKPSSTVDEVIKKMKRLKFERLPVVIKGELVGVITARDILNFHPEFYPEFDELEQIKEEQEKLKRIKKAKSNRIMKEGICDECGNYSLLQKTNEGFLCEFCRD